MSHDKKILGPDGRPIPSASSKSHSNKKIDNELNKDLLKIFLDKFLIGVLLIFAALIGNFLLENHKSDTAFIKELNLIRAHKIGETWESIYALESIYLDSISKMSDILIREGLNRDRDRRHLRDMERKASSDPPIRDKIMKELENYRNKIGETQQRLQAIEAAYSKQLAETNQLISRNRFWLGERQHVAADAFVSIFLNGGIPLQNKAEFDEHVEIMQKKIEKGRQYIQEMRIEILFEENQ